MNVIRFLYKIRLGSKVSRVSREEEESNRGSMDNEGRRNSSDLVVLV